MRSSKLNPEQRKLLQEKALEMVRENPRASLQQISLALGLNHGAVWLWISDNIDGFAPKYQKALQDAFAQLEAPAIAALSDLVEEKNFQAVKYVLDGRGYKPVDKVEQVNSIDINVSLEDEENG